MIAYAWASGLIGFGPKCPKRALPIANHDDEAKLRDTIHGTARKARQSNSWLVPGVPEAADGNAAVNALVSYSQQVMEALKRENP